MGAQGGDEGVRGVAGEEDGVVGGEVGEGEGEGKRGG